jgi:hypothetical protein
MYLLNDKIQSTVKLLLHILIKTIKSLLKLLKYFIILHCGLQFHVKHNSIPDDELRISKHVESYMTE